MRKITKEASFEFSPDLLYLLKHNQRVRIFTYQFNGPQTAKHLIEALGVPHTEVSQILVNHKKGDLHYQVENGDFIQVISEGEDHTSTIQQNLEPHFVLDGHLGRLTAYLRMLGLDCLYQNSYSDPDLVRISVDERRILLTRDRRLLMHKSIQLGYLIRSLEPEAQLREVIQRFALKSWVRPFQRCLLCNQELLPVEKETIIERLKPLTRKYFDEFRICPGCQQIYWKGSHYERMLLLIQQASDPPDKFPAE